MSEEKEINNDEQVVNENAENVDTTASEAENEKVSEPTAEERYAELNNKYLRLHAEFDNFRKRTNKEKIDLINTASASVLKDIIPTLDDFERAIKNNETSQDIDSVKEGFKLIFNKFRTTLESKGLKAMDSEGKDFDVEIHEAIANIPAPSKKQRGKVIEAVEKGYYLNDKVIRFAKVVVGQ